MKDIQSLYTKHPAREYRQAFDLVGSWLNHTDGAKLCLLSSSVFAVELLKRCPHQLDLIGTDGFDAAGFISRSLDWNWGELKLGSIDVQDNKYEIIIWVEPITSQPYLISRQLCRVALPKAKLFVISPGLLNRFIPSGVMLSHNEQKLLIPYQFTQTLKNTGWQIESTMGFHGPRSILWNGFYRLSTQMGRLDWADKLLFVMRSSYQESGRLWWLSPLSIICASAN